MRRTGRRTSLGVIYITVCLITDSILTAQWAAVLIALNTIVHLQVITGPVHIVVFYLTTAWMFRL